MATHGGGVGGRPRRPLLLLATFPDSGGFAETDSSAFAQLA